MRPSRAARRPGALHGRRARRRSSPRPRSAWASTSPTSAGSSTHEVADSLDSYYQEVGRAGRDGEPADGPCSSTAPRTSGCGASSPARAGRPRRARAVALARSTAPRRPVDRPSCARRPAVGDQADDGGLAPGGGGRGRGHRRRGGRPDRRGDRPSPPRPRGRGRRSRPRASSARAIEMMRGYAESGRAAGARTSCPTSASRVPTPCGNCDNCEAGLGDSGMRRGAVRDRRAGRARRVGRGDGAALRATTR